MTYTVSDVSDDNITLADPTADILHVLNEVWFSTALASANQTNISLFIHPGLSPSQSILAYDTVMQHVFLPDYQ